jgi:hypothetical protein
MNEELQKQIAEILKQAITAAHQGGQWLAGQIPDVLRQLLLWTMAQGVLTLIAAIILIVAWVKFIPRHYKWVMDARGGQDRIGASVFLVIPTALVSFLIFTRLLRCILDGIQAAIAPKLFLLEYADHLVK